MPPSERLAHAVLAADEVEYTVGRIAAKAFLALARCQGMPLRGVHLAGYAARISILGVNIDPANAITLLPGHPGGKNLILDIFPVSWAAVTRCCSPSHHDCWKK